MTTQATPDTHRFIRAPHRLILALSLPVFFSMIAEPLTGLVDTAFVARLGVAPLAALGIATTGLSSVFWIFNFLGIGTQTEVSQALGEGNPTRAARQTTLALLLSVAFGLALMALSWPLLGPAARVLGATAPVERAAVAYMQVRLLGGPAVLLTMTAFGALRGQQDMQTPLWIALAVNAVNVALDALLIFGFGPIPALGIAGAAWASTVAQWGGALVAVAAVVRQLGWTRDVRPHEAAHLLRVGGDLFVRTGLLTLFLLLATRVANRMGPESGAAYQAIRQVWLFASMGLDALALTAQSLVGFFIGAGWVSQARRVARLSSGWGVALGALLGGVMVLGQDAVAVWLVPPAARAAFVPAWQVTAAIQPILAVAFVTDGIHWGTGDYAFLRNAMLVATGIASLGLLWLDVAGVEGLVWVWVMMGGWNALRALLGALRVWPGLGDSPFRRRDQIRPLPQIAET